ncbi:MAG: Tn3 family transposase [Alphaproteobacteria bacterium]|nr:Tn3 family transposase [Alphaproteobacteria bacterium]
MTKLSIISTIEQRQFDSPPAFEDKDRQIYFSLNNEASRIIQTLRTLTNQVGFILQLGYFKSNGKFFTSQQFHNSDIEYVCETLGVNTEEIDLKTYQKKIPSDHQSQILKLLHWQPLNKAQEEKIKTRIYQLVKQHLPLKQIFLSIIDFCWQRKIELPSYNQLSTFITQAYNNFELDLLKIINQSLSSSHQAKLQHMTGLEKQNKNKMQRPPLTLIKHLNQSLRPSDIQESIEAFKLFKEPFHEFKSIFQKLNLSDQATEYFATWVQKSTTFQLTQFADKNKVYLYLLCYVKHQFFYRQDALTDIFLKSVQAALNSAYSKANQDEQSNRSSRNQAIRQLSSSHKSSRKLIEEITAIIKNSELASEAKVFQVESLVDAYNAQNTSAQSQLIELENSLDKIAKNQTFFEALESLSLKLQRRVSNIVKDLEFNPQTSDPHILAAINYFISCDGELGSDAPCDFFKTDEKEHCYNQEKLKVSLYKILLFIHMAEAIKAGRLNLLYSYRYKAIQDYLINEETWKSQRQSLLQSAGLDQFENFKETMDKLKEQLDSKYQHVNERFLKGENNLLTVDENHRAKISTPKIESSEEEYASSLLCQAGFVPILRVLTDIEQITQFTGSFKHFSVKHKKMKPNPETVFAGILGKGCNIGLNRLAHISIGINEEALKNMVNWHFNLKNVQSANNKIIRLIDKLFLSSAFRYNLEELHTSSDGRKVNVAVDSLIASYSYKYFGKGKGVTIYLFLDERQLLFHSTVISSSEREAAYVIDGLLQNEVIKSNIHSTDTHGFTETVFAATHFIGTAFAPRLKNISDQKIYAFSDKKTYEARDYKVLPSRILNLKLIEQCWDDILRFMVTLKLKHTSASQLFKRLSSYAKDHPLYKALKEFGRIIKSIFILTYFDNLELRQRIEKQLNKVELTNKFSKAVFFANNQEFKQGEKEEQEIAAACKVLIQNAIILWNYLYLSQLLTSNASLEERKQMIAALQRGSIIVWQHINMQGEYDFTKHAANQNSFDMKKIMGLNMT